MIRNINQEDQKFKKKKSIQCIPYEVIKCWNRSFLPKLFGPQSKDSNSLTVKCSAFIYRERKTSSHPWLVRTENWELGFTGDMKPLSLVSIPSFFFFYEMKGYFTRRKLLLLLNLLRKLGNLSAKMARANIQGEPETLFCYSQQH